MLPFFLFGISSMPLSAFGLQLEVPLQCEIGKSCWIQQYADHDPTNGAADYTCGAETYDGHDGTDFRIPYLTSDVNVIAAAGGVVKALRDGMEDRLASTPALLAAVKAAECGNGVVIAHEDGFETQYCHMKKDSIAVKPGQQIAAGDLLGKVGYSGAAAFPHVHLSVRHNGEKIDPFSGPVVQDCHASQISLWSKAAAAALSYKSPSLIEIGWAQQAVSDEMIEHGSLAGLAPAANWPAVVGYARLINLKQSDVVALSAFSPAGEIAHSQQVLDRSKAQYLIYAGQKAHEPWPVGGYRIILKVTRDGKDILAQESFATIK